MWGQIAAAVIGAGLSYASAKKLQKDQYTDMRKSAQRAGLNPLTVLRTGGGYTAVPHMSKYAAFGQAIDGIFDAYNNKEVDKYNKQVRELEIKQRIADLELTNMTIGKMSKPIVNNIAKIPTGMTILKANTKANVTTDEGVDLPNDPAIPTGYTVPKEVMEQFPVHLGGVSLSGSPMSPAATVEEQYGDIASWLYGPAKLIGDLYYTGMKAAVEAGAQGFNHPMRGKVLKKRLNNQAPQLSKLRFGPNYSDRLSMEGFAYNY